MRKIIVASLLLAATAAATPFPGEWVDLFPPPFNTCPHIIEDIECVSGDLCYVPAGDSGSAQLFKMMKFDGQFSGTFTPMKSTFDIVLAAVGAGGTTSNPHALAAGMGDALYLKDGTSWELPFAIPFLTADDIRADKETGMHIGFLNGFTSPNTFAVSHDGGASLTEYNNTAQFDMVDPQCQWPYFTAIADAGKTFYQAYANWPNNQQATRGGSNPMHQRSKRNSRRRPGSKTGDNSCGYAAGLAKSVDGGQTWSVVHSISANYYYQEIDCVSGTHCVIVGESVYNYTGPNTGAFIFIVEEGKTVTQVFHKPSINGEFYGLRSVRFSKANPTHVWAGGQMRDTKGVWHAWFLLSTDSGKTWREYQTLDYIGGVLSLDATDDGQLFAACITVFEDSTILRFNATGLPPTPPPANPTIHQKICADPACDGTCKTFTLPQNECLPMVDSKNKTISMRLRCRAVDRVIVQNIYPLSTTCGLIAIQSFIPLDKCNSFDDRGQIMFTSLTCDGSSEEPVVTMNEKKPLAERYRKPLSRGAIHALGHIHDQA